AVLIDTHPGDCGGVLGGLDGLLDALADGLVDVPPVLEGVKRIWRCGGDCGVSWRERHPEIPPRATLTGHPRHTVVKFALGHALVTHEPLVPEERPSSVLLDQMHDQFIETAIRTGPSECGHHRPGHPDRVIPIFGE